MIRGLYFWCFLALVALIFGCEKRPGPQSGGETHWLSACVDGSECGDGECLCGVCTRLCGGDVDCQGGAGSWCYELTSPALTSRCEAEIVTQDTAICLALCESDADCDTGLECLNGACVTDSTLDFGTSELALTQPDPTILLDDSVSAELLLGDWEQLEFDGVTPCQAEGDTHTQPRCLRMRVEQAPGNQSQAIGTLYWLREDQVGDDWFGDAPDELPDNRFGPPAPGELYPPETEASFGALEWGVPYRALDGVYANERLEFWISQNDLWTHWCALQPPVAMSDTDPTRYSCSNDADDEELFRMCNVAPILGYCFSNCDCAELPEEACTLPVCECDEEGCFPALRNKPLHAQFELRDGLLVGTLDFLLVNRFAGPELFQLRKVER